MLVLVLLVRSDTVGYPSHTQMSTFTKLATVKSLGLFQRSNHELVDWGPFLNYPKALLNSLKIINMNQDPGYLKAHRLS